MFLRGGAGEAGQRVPDAPGAPGPRPRRRPARHRLGRRRSRGFVPSVRPGPTCAPGTAALEPPAPPPRAFIRRRRKVPLGGVTPQRPRTFAEVPAAPGLGSRASPARARSPALLGCLLLRLAVRLPGAPVLTAAAGHGGGLWFRGGGCPLPTVTPPRGRPLALAWVRGVDPLWNPLACRTSCARTLGGELGLEGM